MVSKERNYGIDLLRLVLMYMVCILHVLGGGGILGASFNSSLKNNTFWFLEVFSYCAVDGFAIISGYMSSDRPHKYEKIVEMWFQVFFYSFILTLIFYFIGIYKTWSFFDAIRCFLPVTFGKFWYFTAFFGLFFSIPILNRYLLFIDEKNAKKSFVVIVIFFSIMSIFGDPFKVNKGYSTIWLIALYCLGVLAKRIKLFETKKSFFLILLFSFCTIISWGLKFLFGIDRLISYVSPTILLSGMIMVILFSRIKTKGTIIKRISPLAFGVYLFQLNQVIWNQVINNSFSFIVNKPLIIGISYVFAFSFLIFIAGLFVEFIRKSIANYIKIPALSKRIVNFINKFLDKFSIFLR